MVTGQVEKDFDQLLRVTPPLAHNSRGAYVEKGCAALCRHCLSQHSLTSARRPEEQYTLPRFQHALKKMRILHGHQHCFFKESLGVCQAHDVGEADVRIRIDDFVLNRHCKLAQLRIVAEVRQWLQDSILEEFLDLFAGVFLLRLGLNHSAL